MMRSVIFWFHLFLQGFESHRCYLQECCDVLSGTKAIEFSRESSYFIEAREKVLASSALLNVIFRDTQEHCLQPQKLEPSWLGLKDGPQWLVVRMQGDRPPECVYVQLFTNQKFPLYVVAVSCGSCRCLAETAHILQSGLYQALAKSR